MREVLISVLNNKLNGELNKGLPIAIKKHGKIIAEIVRPGSLAILTEYADVSEESILRKLIRKGMTDLQDMKINPQTMTKLLERMREIEMEKSRGDAIDAATLEVIEGAQMPVVVEEEETHEEEPVPAP